MLLFVLLSVLLLISIVTFSSVRTNIKHWDQIINISAVMFIITTILVLFLSILIAKEIISDESDFNKDIRTYEYLISLDEEDLSYPYIQYKVKEWNNYITNHQILMHNPWVNWYVHKYYDSFTTISIPGE